MPFKLKIVLFEYNILMNFNLFSGKPLNLTGVKAFFYYYFYGIVIEQLETTQNTCLQLIIFTFIAAPGYWGKGYGLFKKLAIAESSAIQKN